MTTSRGACTRNHCVSRPAYFVVGASPLIRYHVWVSAGSKPRAGLARAARAALSPAFPSANDIFLLSAISLLSGNRYAQTCGLAQVFCVWPKIKRLVVAWPCARSPSKPRRNRQVTKKGAHNTHADRMGERGRMVGRREREAAREAPPAPRHPDSGGRSALVCSRQRHVALCSLAEGRLAWKLVARRCLSHGAADHLLRFRAVPGCDGSSERVDVHLAALLEG